MRLIRNRRSTPAFRRKLSRDIIIISSDDVKVDETSKATQNTAASTTSATENQRTDESISSLRLNSSEKRKSPFALTGEVSSQRSHKKHRVNAEHESVAHSLSPSKQAQQIIIISSDSEASGVNTNPGHVATTGVQEKFNLDPSLRHIVETVFPSSSSLGPSYKATLERAFATSRKLREDYVITHFLGSGASGFVLAAKYVCDNRKVAIKIIPHTKCHDEEDVMHELDIMMHLRGHDNVLYLVEYFTSSLPGDVDPISYIVTEMASFDLFNFINHHSKTPFASNQAKPIQLLPKSAALLPSVYNSTIQEDDVRSIFTQLAYGLHSLHSQNIVHGDIKDRNALISVDQANNAYCAKICDFGHSTYIPPGSAPSFSFYGTTLFAPPEMDRNIEERQKLIDLGYRKDPVTSHLFSGDKADVWALGLILYNMVHGDIPKEVYDANEDRSNAYRLKRASPFALQADLDLDLKDLLTNILAIDPTKRLSMGEVLSHPWMTKKHQQ
ncbi:hypothetical protein BGZ49_006589 [Haplosporangium sp. Z 27]|nr:hypothetical protein BGZ49_006589 [Haplosporangium sp. Z 27]